ncbi:MAG: TlpA family protein disulfide reductase [bacterium]|nr:TlpA family protein disulfide reductase [bacterium]
MEISTKDRSGVGSQSGLVNRAHFVRGLLAQTALVASARAAAAAAGVPHSVAFQRGIIAPGHPMPGFRAPTLGGKELTLASYRGYAVWLNLFASWCHPCQEEMPRIVRASHLYARAGLRVIGIDMSESPGPVHAFVERYNIQFPVVLDHGQATSIWGISDIPTSTFLDRRGVVRIVHLGALQPREITAAITTVLRR